MSVDLFYIALGFIATISVIFGVLTWRAGRNPDRWSRLDAWFEVIVGVPAFVLFGWLTVNAFMEGEVWFAARLATPVLIARDMAPETYWLAQGVNILLTLGCALMAHDGLTKVRRRYDT